MRNTIKIIITACPNRFGIAVLMAGIMCCLLQPELAFGQNGFQAPNNYQTPDKYIPVEHLPSQQKLIPDNSVVDVKSNPETMELKKPLEVKKSAGQTGKGTSPVSVLPALACCLGILMVFWLATLSFKKKSPQFAPSIPAEALEFLGRKSIDLRSSIYYLRCGNRILIVGHSEAGLQTLGEVTDPLEVDIISGLCRAEKSRETTITESFKTLFLRTQPAESGPMPTSSLRDRLQKPVANSTPAPAPREGRRI